MCSTALHEEDKLSPAALAEHYDAHEEPWHLAGDVLLLFTCRRCRSTIALLSEPAPYICLPPGVDAEPWLDELLNREAA